MYLDLSGVTVFFKEREIRWQVGFAQDLCFKCLDSRVNYSVSQSLVN